jgi:hypothetical protein
MPIPSPQQTVSQTKSATIVALELKESLQKVDKNEVLY